MSKQINWRVRAIGGLVVVALSFALLAVVSFGVFNPKGLAGPLGCLFGFITLRSLAIALKVLCDRGAEHRGSGTMIYHLFEYSLALWCFLGVWTMNGAFKEDQYIAIGGTFPVNYILFSPPSICDDVGGGA